MQRMIGGKKNSIRHNFFLYLWCYEFIGIRENIQKRKDNYFYIIWVFFFFFRLLSVLIFCPYLCSNLYIIVYFVLKVFSFIIYMWMTVEKKKESHFDGTSSYTYQLHWNWEKDTKKYNSYVSIFFFLFIVQNVVSFMLYMWRTVKRKKKDSIWLDFFLYIWIPVFGFEYNTIFVLIKY
jgi:hypothetical protein